MSLQGEHVLLRAYFQSADRTPHTPTYERLVVAARKAGLSGATVLKGILGYGAHGLIRKSPWSLVEHVPVIVEIVDAGERIVPFVEGPAVQLMVGGMITLERAHVMIYRQRSHDPPGGLQLGRDIAPLSTLPSLSASPHMTVNDNGVLLRVFIGESDRFEHRPLYEAIVQKARELGLAGATVLRGVEGFGAASVVHKASLLEMSTDLPIVIEIVDSEERINLLAPFLNEMVTEGMITMEHVRILLYRHESPSEPVQP
jgi:hypothetical protein